MRKLFKSSRRQDEHDYENEITLHGEEEDRIESEILPPSYFNKISKAPRYENLSPYIPSLESPPRKPDSDISIEDSEATDMTDILFDNTSLSNNNPRDKSPQNNLTLIYIDSVPIL